MEFAHATGKSPALFAFNSEGACPQCEGLGYIPFDMHFLGDVKQFCDTCKGSRYSEEALQYRVRGLSIADVLRLTIEEAQNMFGRPEVQERLRLMHEVGLGYLEVGQSLGELSGGERQRLKIAERLTSRGKIYVLDEPTRGLHPADVAVLLRVLNRLIDAGNTLIVVEHDLDVIKTADWVVDLGPGGGSAGGHIVASGTPEEIAGAQTSRTGLALRPKLGIAL
jgi:excinuclease UvrABC ATPase subunit